MKRLLVISVVLLSLCGMSIARCALPLFEGGNKNGMSLAAMDEDVELRDQADHADQLCRLSKSARDIIDGYAPGPHLFPRIKDWKWFEKNGRQGIKISAKEDIIFFVSPCIDVKKMNILFGDSTGLFGLIIERCNKQAQYTIFQEMRANKKELQNVSCVASHALVDFLDDKTAARMAVTTADKKFTIFTSGGNAGLYNVPSFDRVALWERKIGAVGLLKPGYLENIVAIADQTRNERKTKKKKKEDAKLSLLFDHEMA